MVRGNPNGSLKVTESRVLEAGDLVAVVMRVSLFLAGRVHGPVLHGERRAGRRNDADSRHGDPPADGEAAIRLTLISVRRPATGYPPAAGSDQRLLITMAPLSGNPSIGTCQYPSASPHDRGDVRPSGHPTRGPEDYPGPGSPRPGHAPHRLLTGNGTWPARLRAPGDIVDRKGPPGVPDDPSSSSAVPGRARRCPADPAALSVTKPERGGRAYAGQCAVTRPLSVRGNTPTRRS